MQETNEDQAFEDVIVAIASAQYEVESAQESLNEAKQELSNAIQLLERWVEQRATGTHPHPILRATEVATLPDTNVTAVLEEQRPRRVLLEEARARARVWAEKDRKLRAKRTGPK
jgi:outer membrane protein TolC